MPRFTCRSSRCRTHGLRAGVPSLGRSASCQPGMDAPPARSGGRGDRPARRRARTSRWPRETRSARGAPPGRAGPGHERPSSHAIAKSSRWSLSTATGPGARTHTRPRHFVLTVCRKTAKRSAGSCDPEGSRGRERTGVPIAAVGSMPPPRGETATPGTPLAGEGITIVTPIGTTAVLLRLAGYGRREAYDRTRPRGRQPAGFGSRS